LLLSFKMMFFSDIVLKLKMFVELTLYLKRNGWDER
jgi:hypothetical protein